MPAHDPDHRSAAATIGARARWDTTTDPAARTAATAPGRAAAREALWQRLLREADPDGTLPEHIAIQRAEELRKEHYDRLSQAGLAKRRQNREAREAAKRAEAAQKLQDARQALTRAREARRERETAA